MKQRLLSIMAVAALSASAMAQTWTVPVDPASTGADVIEGGTYYIKNVGCGQYIEGANSWATQISVSTTGAPYLSVVAEGASVEEQNPETGDISLVEGFKLKLNGTFYFSGDHNRNNYEVTNKYFFRDSEASGFVDLGSQARNAIWVLTKDDNGYYRIQSTTESGAFPYAAEQYAYASTPGQAVQFNMTEAEVDDVRFIEWLFIPTSVSAEEIAHYGALVNLYEQLNAAVEAGADYAEASAVYTNESSTTEEIAAAAQALAGAIRAKKLQDLVATYSGDPVDITEFALVNASFDAGNIEGWEVTEGMGQNLGYQAGAAQTDADGNAWNGYENGDIRISQFIEAWRNGAALSNGVIAQTIYGLPEGHYLLEADGIATDQVNNEDVYGVYLFYDNGTFVYTSEESLSTGDGFPEHLTFEFDFDGAPTVKLGLMTKETNANWMCADNFRLSYLGPVTVLPSYTALRNALASAKTYQDTYPKAEATVLEQLTSAIAGAESLLGATADESLDAQYTEAIAVLSDATAAVKESEAAYTQLYDFIQQLTADDDKYGNAAGYEAFASDVVEPLLDRSQDAYDQGAWTPEQISAEIEAYKPLIKTYTQEIFDAAVASGESLSQPIDITMLFDHMDFAYGTTQTAFAGGYPAADEENGISPVWLNETGDGNFKTNYSTAEVWNNRPFNIYREFQNLPKGRYTIQTHAFFRVEANDSNYPNWQGDNDYGKGYAYLYAGDSKAPLLNVAAIACPEFVDLSSPYDCTDGNYLPNNQASAYLIFTDERFAAQAEQTLVQASGNVLNDGDVLRVGVAGTADLQANHWTIWHGFSLLYNGAVSPNDLNDDLQALIDEASELFTGAVQEAENKKEAAITNGETALGIDDLDTKVSAMTQLREAIEYANASDALIATLQTTKENYEERIYNLPGTPTDETFIALLQSVDEAFYNDNFLSNEQIQGWIDAMNEGWVPNVLSMDILDEASIDNPVELTALIANAGFDSNNKDGWNVTQEGNAGGDGSGAAEFWGATSFDINQTLPTLRDGYYRLSVDAFYRFGGTASELAALADGSITNPEFFYVNSKEINVMQWSNTENGAYLASGEDDEYAPVDGTAKYTVTPAESEPYSFWAVNNKDGFENVIADGRYHNEILFGYGVEGGFTGAVTFGLRKADKPSSDNDWCPFDNFRLEYLGTVAPDAIGDIAAADRAAAATAVYSLDGRRQATLARGINIVRRADGTVSKVLVK